MYRTLLACNSSMVFVARDCCDVMMVVMVVRVIVVDFWLQVMLLATAVILILVMTGNSVLNDAGES